MTQLLFDLEMSIFTVFPISIMPLHPAPSKANMPYMCYEQLWSHPEGLIPTKFDKKQLTGSGYDNENVFFFHLGPSPNLQPPLGAQGGNHSICHDQTIFTIQGRRSMFRIGGAKVRKIAIFSARSARNITILNFARIAPKIFIFYMFSTIFMLNLRVL